MIDMAEYALHFYVKKGESFWSSVTFKTPASARKRAFTMLDVMPREAKAEIYEYDTDTVIDVLFIGTNGKDYSDHDHHLYKVNRKTGGLIR